MNDVTLAIERVTAEAFNYRPQALGIPAKHSVLRAAIGHLPIEGS
jgi:hypothetical protein